MSAIPRWHKGTARWGIKIGHELNKNGDRVRKWFYFAAPKRKTAPPEVIADAVAKQREWKELKKNWASMGPMLAEFDADYDYSRPVWYDKEALAHMQHLPDDVKAEIAKADRVVANLEAQAKVKELSQVVEWGKNQADLIGYLRGAGLLPKGVLVPTRQPNISQAITEYLAAQRKRIDLKIGQRIDVGTYNTARNNLLICLGLSIAPEPQVKVKIIDLQKPLLSLDNKDIDAIAAHWMVLPGGVNRRTVKNYFGGFRAFLRWAEAQDDLGFLAPKSMAKVLYVAGGNANGEVTETDYKTLKDVLKVAPERVKMYALLALTCGFYQADICKLMLAEVQQVDGATFITGYRSKEDAEIKEATKIKTTHWIAPEIAAMMESQRARSNQWGFYFLNRYGTPMFHEKVDGGKYNVVSHAWDKARTSAGKGPTFRQLRKWGWNELQKYGTDKVCQGEMLAKRWAGQSGGGVSAVYRFEDYRPVIAAQKRWWNVLKRELELKMI